MFWMAQATAHSSSCSITLARSLGWQTTPITTGERSGLLATLEARALVSVRPIGLKRLGVHLREVLKRSALHHDKLATARCGGGSAPNWRPRAAAQAHPSGPVGRTSHPASPSGAVRSPRHKFGVHAKTPPQTKFSRPAL